MEAKVGELADQEIERVFVFGEDQQPFVSTGDVLRDDISQFLKLRFLDVLLGMPGKLNEAAYVLDLSFEFSHVLSHRQPFNNVILELPSFGFGQIVKVFGKLAVFLFQLAKFLKVFKSLAAAFKRATNCSHTGSQSALQNGKRQTDVAVFCGDGPLKIVLDIFGNGVVQLQFFGREFVGQCLNVPGREAR